MCVCMCVLILCIRYIFFSYVLLVASKATDFFYPPVFDSFISARKFLDTTGVSPFSSFA